MKKTIRFWFYALPVSFIFLSSCDMVCMEGKGPVRSETRQLNNFSGLRLNVGANVIIEQDSGQAVVIDAQDNILKNITTEIRDETLIIENTECIGSNKGISIHIRIPEVKKLIVSGSGDIVSQGKLTAERLELGIKGSGSIKAEVDVKRIYSGIKGSGDIVVKGNTEDQFIKIDGSGNYMATDLASVSSKADINGSGEISVFSLKKLNVSINGSGTLRYKGSPDITSNVNGSGSVEKID